MPYKANQARRHKIPKARYKVANWPEYDRALQHRGSLTVWVTPEALAAWHPPRTGRRGRSPHYADIAIETGHLLRLCHGNRADAQRLLRSERPSCRRRRRMPLRHGLRAADPKRAAGDQVALDVEGVVGGGVHGDEALGGAGRLEALHLPLPSAERLVRGFGPVVL